MFSRMMILATTLAAIGCSAPSEETQDRESVATTQTDSSGHAGMVHDSSGDAIAHAESGAADHSMHAQLEGAADHASMGHVAPAGADHAAMTGMQHGAVAPSGDHRGQVAAAVGHPAGHQAPAAAHAVSGAAHNAPGVAHQAPGAGHGEHDAAAAPGHGQHSAMPEHPAMADSAAHGQHGAQQHAMPADTGHAAHGAMADSAHVMAGDSAMHGEHDAMPGMDHGAQTGAAQGGAHDAGPGMQHEMAMFDLGGGWMVIGMAQAFPIGTIALPAEDGTPLGERALYLTQPAIMFNVESPLSRVSLRTTLNFEGLTQPDGELTFGGWGEGFIDKRHPHTLLHEAMLSVNVWARDGGGFSLSAGKGFAPYGTDDPMSRPVVKYPTNHHLSQILERFTLNGVYSSPRFSAEVGVFGGNEPTTPYDFSNAESFANSWSTRLAARFGAPAMGVFPWELSGSYGYVVEEHDAEQDVTVLYNAALRRETMTATGRSYALVEASMSEPEHHAGYFSVLAEAAITRGIHMPYARVEYATRPEYPREGEPGTDEFFRYDHDDEPIGSTRWLIAVAGYGLEAASLPFSARPFVEVQWNQVAADEGGVDPEDLFGRSSFFGLTAGFRLFLGGEPMRMGAYGVLDAATFMHRMQMGEVEAEHAEH